MAKCVKGVLLAKIIKEANAESIDWHTHVDGQFTSCRGAWMFSLEYSDKTEIKLVIRNRDLWGAGERVVYHPALEDLKKAVFDQHNRKLKKFFGIDHALKIKSSRGNCVEREKLNNDLRMVLRDLEERGSERC